MEIAATQCGEGLPMSWIRPQTSMAPSLVPTWWACFPSPRESIKGIATQSKGQASGLRQLSEARRPGQHPVGLAPVAGLRPMFAEATTLKASTAPQCTTGWERNLQGEAKAEPRPGSPRGLAPVDVATRPLPWRAVILLRHSQLAVLWTISQLTCSVLDGPLDLPRS